MADNSVGGLNIRIGADISEGERQIQKFVREFDTALKELSMGRRGGMYTTSAFRNAVEREQSRAQEEFARAGVVSGVNQVDPEAYRRLLMRNSGYAELAAQEEKQTQKFMQELALRSRMQRAADEGNVALEHAYRRQIEELRESSDERMLRMINERADREVSIVESKLERQLQAEARAVAAFESMQASQLTRVRNLPVDIATGEVDQRRAEIYMLRKAGETAEADARQQQLNEEERFAEKRAQVTHKIELHARAIREAMLAKDYALEAIHWQSVANLRQDAADKELQDIRDQAQKVLEQERRADEEYFQNERMNWKRIKELERAPFMREVETLQRSRQWEEADIVERIGRRRLQIESELNQVKEQQLELENRKLVIVGMINEAKAKGQQGDVQQLEEMMQRIDGQISSLTKQSNGMKVGANNAKYAVMNLAYGVQDAATVFGTSGFAGAIRASANNLTALGPLMNDIKSGATTLAQALLQPEVMMIGGATAALIAVDAYTAYQRKQEELRAARIKEMAEFRMEEMRARPGQAQQAVEYEVQLQRAQESGAEAAYELARSQSQALEAKQAAVDVSEKQLAQESAILQELINQKNAREEMQGQVVFQSPQAGRGAAGVQAAMQSREQQAGLAALQERIEAQQQRVKQLQEDTDKAHKERGRAEADALKAEENYNEARLKADEKTRRDLDIERMMFERKEQLRFSDIAIAQTERILGERVARVAQLRQQAQAGPQFASMVAAGTQEDVAARLRMRAGTAAIDPLLEEAKKQVIEQREIRDELRAIREKMQPGYMVETFRP